MGTLCRAVLLDWQTEACSTMAQMVRKHSTLVILEGLDVCVMCELFSLVYLPLLLERVLLNGIRSAAGFVFAVNNLELFSRCESQHSGYLL